MALHLHNTLSGGKEAFRPIEPAHVRMYVCGPTVYDHPHIGNARPAVAFDVLYRLLKKLYPKVTYVRNFTDVDDKINARAKAEGVAIGELTGRMTEVYLQDMGKLNVLPPDVEPRATAHLPEMIQLIEKLIATGNAYLADGHVLFHVPSWAEYGKFARRSTEELIAGARVDVAPYKRDPMDFVLWKPSDAATPGWDSPWGRGRPGWHIECSAMAKKYLGITFDIHGGGQDLIFPHHQNEVAQSVCAHDGQPLANYWVHNGFVIVEGEKMSKSLGNFFTVRDLLAEFPGEAIRLALLQTHYRQPLDFTRGGLRQAKRILDRWYQALGDGEEPKAQDSPEVLAALEDDLNTPRAISVLHDLAHRALRDGGDAWLAQAQLRGAAQMLGVLEQDRARWLFPVFESSIEEAEIKRRITERDQARKDKHFKLSDQIRDEMIAKGIVLEDGPKGTTWRRAG